MARRATRNLRAGPIALAAAFAWLSATPAVSEALNAPNQTAAASSRTSGPTAPAAAPAATPPAAAAVTPDPYTDGSAQAGAAKAAMCFACHGPNGNSQNPAFPRLAGQNAVYIAEQLRLFRSGVRTNPVMQPMAASLSDRDIDDLAVYFAAQAPLGLEADPSYWKAGEALYLHGDRQRGVPGCVACHGPIGRGNPAAGYPALAAQQSVYVVSQLEAYANGTRYTNAHATPNSAIMFTIAKHLTPEEMRDVASYVQGLR